MMILSSPQIVYTGDTVVPVKLSYRSVNTDAVVVELMKNQALYNHDQLGVKVWGRSVTPVPNGSAQLTVRVPVQAQLTVGQKLIVRAFVYANNVVQQSVALGRQKASVYSQRGFCVRSGAQPVVVVDPVQGPVYQNPTLGNQLDPMTGQIVITINNINNGQNSGVIGGGAGVGAQPVAQPILPQLPQLPPQPIYIPQIPIGSVGTVGTVGTTPDNINLSALGQNAAAQTTVLSKTAITVMSLLVALVFALFQ